MSDTTARDVTDGTTRRRLLGAAAVGAVGAALAGSSDSAARTRRRSRHRRSRPLKAEVVVVGAGISGLTTAYELAKANRSVVVIEARDRVGGRTLSTPYGNDGYAIDRGGEALLTLDQQKYIAALTKELGVEPYRRHDSGKNVYVRDGDRVVYSGASPVDQTPLGTLPVVPDQVQQETSLGRTPPDVLGLPEVALAISKLDSMAKEVPLAEPWKAPHAQDWDSQTFETWKQAQAHNDASRALLNLVIRTFLGVEPRDVSLLFVVASLARIGIGLRQAIEDWGAYRFPHGVQQISIRMAQRLGRRVILSSPVRRIEQDSASVRVISDRAEVVAKQVVVATPPFVTSYITYDPPLPPLRAQLLQRFPQSSVLKFHAFYGSPFWRDDGLNGEAISTDGPISFCGEGTPPEGAPGIMVCFVTGSAGRRMLLRTAAERRQAVLDNLAQFFGQKAHAVTDFYEMLWPEELYTRGGFAGVLPPGVLLDYGEAIRAPFRRIHWSGSEAATEWTGTMEGAVRSGFAAADEVKALL